MRKLLIVGLTSLFLVVTGCQDPTGPLAEPSFQEGGDDGGVATAESIPFRAEFFTDIQPSSGPGSPCQGEFGFFNVQEGEGTATLLGEFTTHLEFCVDVPVENPDPENLVAEYKDLRGSFVAANGDELFIGLLGIGQIFTTDTEGVLVFRDTFLMIGGTGRFAGATGSMVSESFNFGVRTEHVWTGTISLEDDDDDDDDGADSDNSDVETEADLDGNQEVPSVVTDMTGEVKVEIEDGQLAFKLKVSDNTHDIFAAHIHCAPPGVNGPVGVTLFTGSFTAASGTLAEGTVMAPDAENGCGWADISAVADAIQSGNTYVNVHTTSASGGVPSGEIRGNLPGS